jgi:hypothetical protein
MEKKEEFKKLMAEIGDAIVKENEKSDGSEFTIPLITKNILYMLINLNQQIEEQAGHFNGLEEQVIKIEEKFKFLIKELEKLGYLNIKERRSLLRRNILTQEALINLLEKRGLVKKKEVIEEINRLRKAYYKAAQTK